MNLCWQLRFRTYFIANPSVPKPLQADPMVRTRSESMAATRLYLLLLQRFLATCPGLSGAARATISMSLKIQCRCTDHEPPASTNFLSLHIPRTSKPPITEHAMTLTQLGARGLATCSTEQLMHLSEFEVLKSRRPSAMRSCIWQGSGPDTMKDHTCNKLHHSRLGKASFTYLSGKFMAFKPPVSATSLHDTTKEFDTHRQHQQKVITPRAIS